MTSHVSQYWEKIANIDKVFIIYFCSIEMSVETIHYCVKLF